MNIKPVMELNPAYDETAINGVMFYPAERVSEIFSRMAAARDPPEEAAELRIFYRRIKRIYDEQSEIMEFCLDPEKAMPWAVVGEVVADAEFVASITEGAAHGQGKNI
jgi:hypothetical protein